MEQSSVIETQTLITLTVMSTRTSENKNNIMSDYYILQRHCSHVFATLMKLGQGQLLN